MTHRHFLITLLVLGGLTAITPRDCFLTYFLNGFWGVLGTAAAIVFLLLLPTIETDKKDN